MPDTLDTGPIKSLDPYDGPRSYLCNEVTGLFTREIAAPIVWMRRHYGDMRSVELQVVDTEDNCFGAQTRFRIELDDYRTFYFWFNSLSLALRVFKRIPLPAERTVVRDIRTKHV